MYDKYTDISIYLSYKKNMNKRIMLRRKRIYMVENITKLLLTIFAFISIITTILIILSLLFESLPFFREGRFFKLFSYGELWDPRSGHYNILPILVGTIMIVMFSCILAIPLGLGSAVYLSEYASPRARNTIKPILEILAGIPSVVYGFFALLYITPFLKNNISWLAKIFLIVSTLFSLWMCYFTIKKALERDKTKTKVTFYIIALLFGVVFLYEAINFIKFYEMTGLLKVETFNVLSASFAVGIMITPLVASISEDALKSVPSTLREASFGLGSTKYETVIKVVIPAAISGIISSFILGISRAIGETMIVAMAAGAKPVLNFNPLGQIQTMTGYMVSKTFGEVVVGSLEYQTVFVVGLILFFITLSLNVIAKKIVDVYREEY